MPKVITSDKLQEFIETGKHQVIEAKKPEEPKKEEPKAEKPEVKAETPKVDLRADPVKAEEAEKLADELVEADGDMMPEETLEQAKLKINKKHRELKAEKALRKRLQEERDENERFAETQFNERRMVETERDRLRREVEELKSRAEPAKAAEPEIKAPDKNDPKFKNDKGEFEWDKFTEAQAKYAVAQDRAVQKAEADAATRKALEAEVLKRIKKAEEKHPDFLEKVNAFGERKDIPPYINQFIFESEQGAELAYYFATGHYEELMDIAKLSPIKAIARLGKLEDKFIEKVETKVEKAEEKPVPPQAPPPITPITGLGATTVNTDPAKMSFRELRAYERERQRNRH